MAKRKNLTSGMVVTQKQEDCRMFVDDAGCMQYVLVCTSPNPAKPTEPTVQYFVNGVEVPKPGELLPCLEPGTTKPVYVMGGKLAVDGLTALVDLTPLTDALNVLIEEQRKDTPITKTRYCNATTGTWWEKICVVEKQPDNSYQLVVVSDTDTLEACDSVCDPAITHIHNATDLSGKIKALYLETGEIPSSAELLIHDPDKGCARATLASLSDELEQVQTAGNVIATHTDMAGNAVDILETVTSITNPAVANNVLSFDYVDENGDTNTQNFTLPTPVSVVNSIDLKPTGNPNEFTVEIVYTNDQGVQTTITDTTPIVVPSVCDQMGDLPLATAIPAGAHALYRTVAGVCGRAPFPAGPTYQTCAGALTTAAILALAPTGAFASGYTVNQDAANGCLTRADTYYDRARRSHDNTGTGNQQVGYDHLATGGTYSGMYGRNNRVDGGASNNILGAYSRIRAGNYNIATGYSHDIQAGSGHSVNGYNNTVIGGNYSMINAINSTHRGGNYNGGIGYSHDWNGTGNMLLGYNNASTGNYGVALGRNLTIAGSDEIKIANTFQKLSFHNVTPIARQTLPAVASTAQLTTALRNLGLIA